MMQPDELVRAWYVLHTKSRFESVVNDGLLKKSLQVFLPKILIKSKRRDREKMIRVPLFPGYLFVKTDLNPVEHIEIVKTIGAVRLIGNRDRPVAVADETIESLQIMISTDLPISTGVRLKKGDSVIVIHGPFAGVTGTFIRYRGRDRVIVHVEAMGQFAAVEVDETDIERRPDILA